MDRRSFLVAGGACAASAAGAAVAPRQAPIASDSGFAAIRTTLGRGGRLGVMARDTGSGRHIAFDPDGRYAMCSIFKLPLAAFVLWLADKGALNLSEHLKFEAGDPLPNSPVVEANLRRGGLAVETLAAAIVQRSDNSAANLLLRRTGGPAALTRFVRACRDPVTRADRYELALNSNIPGDPRDTTSPAAMVDLAATLALGTILKPSSRERLTGWLKSSIPGADRLRAGVPRAWELGHKTGTGNGGANNDVAVVWRPHGAPIVIASFISGGTATPEARAEAHRKVGELVAARLG